MSNTDENIKNLIYDKPIEDDLRTGKVKCILAITRDALKCCLMLGYFVV